MGGAPAQPGAGTGLRRRTKMVAQGQKVRYAPAAPRQAALPFKIGFFAWGGNRRHVA